MALYVYLKKTSHRSILSHLPSPKKQKAKMSRRTLSLLSATFLLVGLFMIGQVVYPVIGWYLITVPSLDRGLKSPLASTFKPEESPLYPTIVKAEDTLTGGVEKSDSFKPSTWFVGTPAGNSSSSQILKVYLLTIPKLKIDSATVELGGEDLKKSLIAWPTSALPGDYGNNIIFGHSELPQFASPKDYSGIFTHLMELNKDDEVFVDYDGIRYRYQVVDKTVVSPTDLSVLEQRFDSSYLTLITCTPPGTTWERGVIKAQLATF